jgi:hypothetical protein
MQDESKSDQYQPDPLASTQKGDPASIVCAEHLKDKPEARVTNDEGEKHVPIVPLASVKPQNQKQSEDKAPPGFIKLSRMDGKGVEVST